MKELFWGLAILALTAGVAFGLTKKKNGKAAPEEVPSPDEMRRILGAKRVELSTKIRGPIAGDLGQFVVTLADGRQIGVFAMRYRWKAAESPVFWINLVGDDGPQTVLVPTDSKIERKSIPNDWMASDWLRAHGHKRPLSFLALNPRRVLSGDEKRVVAETEFVPQHPMTTNLKGRTTFRIEGKELRVLSVMAYATKDEAETSAVLEKLDGGL